MRSHGEGSLYPEKVHGVDRWTVAFSLPDRNGRRRREVYRFVTKAEARARLRQGPSTSVRSSVGGYLPTWLHDVAAPRLRSSTLARYQSIAEQHLIPALGKIPMDRLAAADIDAYCADRLASGASPRTVQQEHAVLASCLHDAERRGDVARNVARLVSAPRVPRVERAILNDAQLRQFLDATRDQRLWPLYVTCRGIGLRQGEALGLRSEDIDLDRGRLTVQHTLHRRAGRWVLEEPKTERSRRTVTLPPSVVDALREQQRRQYAERSDNRRWNERHLVFTDVDGEPLDGTSVTREFQRTLRRLGLPVVTFHSLRHSAATSMLAQGVPMRVVMETLGHSTITITADLYSHVVPSLADDAAERMERAL